MLEFDLPSEELALTRFGCSVLQELVASLRVLADPGAHVVHLPWVRAVAPRLAGLDLALLRALVPSRGYVPDFLAPPPRSPLPDLSAELAQVRRTPAEQVRAEVAEVFPHGPPAVLTSLVADPATGLERVSAELTRYHAAALREDWPAIGALLEADIAHRARRIAEAGARAMFAELHAAVRWAPGGPLTLDIAYDAPVALDGRGLLLMPSVFAWPSIYVVTDPPWQPTLVYPARGVATVWEPPAPPPPEALARVLGRSRAALLGALDTPRTGTELARRLALTPGAVSQQVSALRGAGLLAAHREGRSLVCRRTRLGDELIASATPEHP